MDSRIGAICCLERLDSYRLYFKTFQTFQKTFQNV
jgi:hypothetical protein